MMMNLNVYGKNICQCNIYKYLHSRLHDGTSFDIITEGYTGCSRVYQLFKGEYIVKKAGIIFFVFIIILTIGIKTYHLMGPVDKYNNNLYTVKIEKGYSSIDIAEKLYEHDLILSKKLFSLLVSIFALDKKLQAGTYALQPAYSMWEIIKIISEGRVATFTITIPEGYNIDEIITRLAAKTSYSEEEYKNIIEGNNIKRNYFPAEESEYRYRPEGFLYPDTYRIPLDFSPQEILAMMVKQFEEKWLDYLQDACNDTKYDIQEIVTIASLIECEAKFDREKRIISAVIYNRLERDMFLQIDAAILYSFAEHKEKLLYSDLKIDSPYNTYLYRGLPPGPICSPGDEAIYAALNPAEVDYLFYFARSDGSHVFTESYNEHLRLQEKVEN